MRCSFGLGVVLAAGAAFPLGAGAQDVEQGASSEPIVIEEPPPPSEPAPEKPALQLEVDQAGVQVAPTPTRTPRGYTLEEAQRRVERARIGLIASAGAYVVAMGLIGGAAACYNRNPSDELFGPTSCFSLYATAGAIGWAGVIGMITSGALMARRKRDRDMLRCGRRRCRP